MKLSETEVSILTSDNLKRNREKVTQYYLNKITDYSTFTSKQEFEEFIQLGFKQANRYGLNTEYSLRQFIYLTLECSSKFDEHDDIRRMLADEIMDVDDKLDAVCKKLIR